MNRWASHERMGCGFLIGLGVAILCAYGIRIVAKAAGLDDESLNILVLVFLLLSMCVIVLFMSGEHQRTKRAMERTSGVVCPACLHDLQGSPPKGECPECGHSYERAELGENWRKQLSPGRRAKAGGRQEGSSESNE